METINHNELKKLLKVYYDTKIPLFLWGTMGIGKSSVIEEFAKEEAKAQNKEFITGESDGKDKFCFIDVRISQLEPTDLRGLPKIEGDITKWLPPNTLPQNKDSCGVLFLDELNLAPQSIQASAYQLILDRKLGDYKLPNGWVIFSAGNTIEDRANVFELSAPLLNRFTHLKLAIPTKDDWVNWAINNGINSGIITFLEFRPSLLYNYERNSKEKSFATPRTWAFTSKLISYDKITDEQKQKLISSAVGSGVAIEYMAFDRLKNKINLKSILEKPESVKNIKEIDLKYSLISLIVEDYRNDKKGLENMLKVCSYLEPEFAILLTRLLVKTRSKDFEKDAPKYKVWLETLAPKYYKYMDIQA